MTYLPHTPTTAGRLTIEVADLCAPLALLASSVVERRNTVPILSNVMLWTEGDSLYLRATDLDVQLTYGPLPCDVESPLCGTVDARMLAATVKGFGKGHLVDLQVEGGRLALRSGRGAKRLPMVPAADFPTLADDNAPAVTMPAGQLGADLARLARLAPFISTEATRYYLNGVAIQAHGAGLSLAATTGSQLARIVRDIAADALPAGAVILPTKAVKLAVKLLKGATGDVELATIGKGNRFTLQGAGWRVVGKLVDGVFPDVGDMVRGCEGESVQAVAFVDLEEGLAPADVDAFSKAFGGLPAVARGERAFVFTSPDAPELQGWASVTDRDSGAKFSHNMSSGAPARALGYLTDLARARGFDLDSFIFSPVPRFWQYGPQEGIMPIVTVIERGVTLGATIGRNDDGEWAEGSFSVPMPRERQDIDSGLVFVAPDGSMHGMRTNSAGKLELSKEAIRRLAGPVDESTHIKIPTPSFYCGEALAPGWVLGTPYAYAGDPLKRTAAEMAQHSADCAPRWMGEGPAPASPFLIDVPAVVEPLETETAPVDAPAVDLKAVEAVGAVAGPVVAVEPVAAPHGASAPAVEPVAAVAAPDDALAATVAALLDRVAALEAGQPVAAPVAPVRAPLAVRRRLVAAYLRMRAERTALRVEAARVADAHATHVARLEADRAELAGSAMRHHARAVRMVSTAARHRTASRRLTADVRAARAEARALGRRLTAGAAGAQPVRIVVGVAGGLVQGVSATGPVEALVLDYDDGAACATPVMFGGSAGAPALETVAIEADAVAAAFSEAI